MLPNNKATNTWRGELFEAILRDVRNGEAGKAYASMFRANVDKVTKELINTLQRLCSGRLDLRAHSQIETISNGLGILGLEMASQRPHVLLERCRYGDRIPRGERGSERFKDDGDGSGSSLDVDLMIQPCLRRVGDGRGDLFSEKVIVKGEIVLLRSGYR